MILFSTVAAAALAAIISFFMPGIYSATAKIMPPQQEGTLLPAVMGQLGSLGTVAGDVLGKGNKADMYLEILKSQAIMDPIIDRFKLMELYHQKYRQFTYKRLEDNASIEAGKKSGIISITVDDKDPKRAAAIANAYVEELDRLMKNVNVTGSGQKRIFLEKRLVAARADLVKAEEALRSFQSRHKTIVIEKQAEATIKGIAELRAQLVANEVQLATFRRQFTESSQEVKNAKSAVNNLRGQIARFEGAGTEDDAIPSVGSVPAIGQEHLRLMREFKTQEAIVDTLNKQRELASISEASTVSTLQVLQTATPPDFKSKPSRRKLVMLVTLSALLLSTAFAFVLENVEKMTDEEKERWRSSAKFVPFLSRYI
jgi:uncharacterized protein involved in exopolysaccharide biosynthesis